MIAGFTGKAGAGKTTAAQTMIDEAISAMAFGTATLMSFAEPIKRVAKESFGWDGQKDEKGRRLLQVIGTEAGREYNPGIWIDALMKKADESGNNTLVCIDDVRFDNEAEVIRERGGHVFAVEGRISNLGLNAAHASERGVDEELITDTLRNDGTREALRERIHDLLDCWLVPQPARSRYHHGCGGSCKSDCGKTGGGPGMSFIQTYSGARFDFADPKPESIRLEDIAHALARICRFGGHASRFYSVADHSLNVARHLAHGKANHATTFAGLLHDAAEAYLGDIVSPLKRMLPRASELENHIARMIRVRFGIDDSQVDFDAITRADETILVAETKALFDFAPLENWTDGFNTEPLRISGHISQSSAEAEFIFLTAAVGMCYSARERRDAAWN